MARSVTYHSKYGGLVVSKTDVRKLKSGLKRKLEDTINMMAYQLSYIGEQAVKVAREKGSYSDVTGNLRSSIGYVVLLNGVAIKTSLADQISVESGYRLVKRKRKDGSEYMAKQKIGGDGSEGAKQARKMLDKLRAEYPRGLVLIVCAAMEYAVYVEAVHHKDVLTSAELEAERLVDKLIAKYLDKDGD